MKKFFSRRQISAIMLIIALLVTLVPVNLLAAGNTGTLDSVVNYYKMHKTNLDSWWELAALKGAGQNLNDGTWTLPQWKSEDLPANTAQPTDYSGCILGLLAMNENPANAMGGRNLLVELAGKQGTNGSFGNGVVNMHIWSMIALDAADGTYNKQNAVTWLLSQQKTDGGFTLSGSSGDPDITGMALEALSRYKEQADVSTAIAKAVSFLKNIQCVSGGFSSLGTENLNSVATVISGLVSVGQDVTSDSWKNNGHSILDALISYQLSDKSFCYQKGQGTNLLATAQSLIALGDINAGKSVFQRLNITQQSPTAKNIHVRVEGSSSNILDKDISVTSAVYAMDALKQTLDSQHISYDIQNAIYGQYIKSIENETAGKLGGYDGWLYLVNGVMPSVGAGDYKIIDGDNLVFYYGMYPPDTLVPQVNIQPTQPKVGDDLTVIVTSSYFDWGSNQTVQKKVYGAAVSFNGLTYTTNANGQIVIPSVSAAGTYILKVSKDNAGSYPGIVRTGSINVIYNNPLPKNIHVRVEGSSSNIVDKDISVTSAVYAMDALKQTLDSENISYDIRSGSWGQYINSIKGEVTGKFGGYDGWIYIVNGVMPSIGAGDYKIKDGDNLVFYYGMYPPDTLIPQVDLQPAQPKVGDNLTVTATSSYDDWNTGNTVTVKVAGAVVSFNGKTYTTDAKGQAVIPSPSLPGTYQLKVSKDNEGSYPSIIRTGSISVIYGNSGNPESVNGSDGTVVTAPVIKNVTLSVTGDSRTILSTRTVTLNDGDTPYSILVRELGSSKVLAKGSNLYVYSIDGLAEFDRGASSGWMYRVNGKSPTISAASYNLNNGDAVEWYYTIDYTKDTGTSQIVSQIAVPEENNNTSNTEIKNILSENIQGIVKKILSQESISDWSAFALAQVVQKVPDKYVETLINSIEEQSGYLHNVTDIARTLLVIKTLGLNPEDIEGYNLIEMLCNYEKVDKQGVTGPVFALIALDSGKYSIPDNAIWTRDKLVSLILEYQNADGGFALTKGDKGGIDLTAMAVQALSNYKDRVNVKAALGKAVDQLSKIQMENGGYKDWDSESSESISQVIIALTSLGIDPKSTQFTKNNGDLLTYLLTFKKEDGCFSHTKDGSSNEMATEQALMAFTAYSRFIEGGNKLYLLTSEEKGNYSDTQSISGWAQPYIEKAAKYNLMQGTDAVKKLFEPQKSISRAEFAALLVRISGEKPSTTYFSEYKDVKQDSWYAGYVLKAKEKGFVSGISVDEFAPEQAITREEMAVMISRAFSLKGNSLNSKVTDLDSASEWARQSIEIVNDKGIMQGDNFLFSPKDLVTREMAAAVAVRLYEMKQ